MATPIRSIRGTLALLSIKGIGSQSFYSLASEFESIEEYFSAELMPKRGASLDSSFEKNLLNQILSHADYIIERSIKLGVEIYNPYSQFYPAWLRSVHDKPPVLYVKGKLDSTVRCVACVGTREPSAFGASVAARISEMFASSGWTVVSGLAIGVDSISHEAALRAKGHTIAVLANGLDSVYPKKNERLAEEIVESGGALVSEQPFGAPAIPRNLVQRDRLQSGMSVATVVMQTDVVGGTMHTVRSTLMQNRMLVVPVPPTEYRRDDKSRGNIALLEMPGNELADQLKAEGDLRQLLTRRFGNRPVALPIHGKEDYSMLLNALENSVMDSEVLRNELLYSKRNHQIRLF